MRILFFQLLLLGIFCSAYSQESLSTQNIDPELLINADAVIRNFERVVEVEASDELKIKTTRIVTVLNEDGERYIRAYINYSENLKIKEQEALIYNKYGEEIQKIKSRDFKDRSNFDSYILFSDNYVSYMDYTPREYPYTVAYTSEVQTKNTIFIADWQPVEGYDVSVEQSSFRLINIQQIPLRFTERNFDKIELTSQNTGFELDYKVGNLPAYEYEILSPDFKSFAPRVLVSLSQFNLEGVEGNAKDWKSFGKWMYDNLVAGHDDISVETVSKISSLTQGLPSVEEKARRIYQICTGQYPVYRGNVWYRRLGTCFGK